MKYDHRFKLISGEGSAYCFKEADINARLDFFTDMLRVAIYKDGSRLFNTFSVCPDGNMPYEGREKLSVSGLNCVTPAVSEDADTCTFSFGEQRLVLEKTNFLLSHFCGEKPLFRDRKYMAYNLDGELGRGACHYLSREEGEYIFGLGDKSGDVNKSGRTFRLGTSDAMGFDASATDPLYKHVPFYICRNTAGAYGIYYDTYADGVFDLGREYDNYYPDFKSFRCEDDYLVYYVFYGDVPGILNAFSRLTGGTFLPPRWSLKYCGSTMAYTDADNAGERLEGFLTLCDKYGISPGGFYMSSGYTQIGEKRYVFHWNTDKIPSPERLSSLYRERGVELLPNIKPCFLDDHPMYKTIAEKGWFLKNADGTPARFPFWGGMGSYLDFTNRDAASFWTDCVRSALVDKGYYSTWNDNNEYDVTDESVMADGFGTPIRAKLIRPLFSFLMTRASIEAGKDIANKTAVTRCGMTGTPRIASTWTGDNRTSFKDFRYNHKMAMTMSLSGIYNFGQDIGGFAGPSPSKELFLRWIQYGIFTPRFVLHSWNPDGSSNMPWLYPDEIDTVKRLFDLREALIPYLYAQMERSVKTYDPVIYPVFLKDADYDPESDAFFFGDDILACPIFDEGADEVEVTLPEGKWRLGSELQDNTDAAAVYEGGSTVKIRCGIRDLPVFFVRDGAEVF
ncbi:MAG: hypothetical protein II694_02040 [Lachnospiraceae bacterium]|nr:hypothetical protein [Lachnospiraceae bacterium]